MKDFLKITLLGFSVYFFSWLLAYGLGINKLSIQSEDTLPALFLPAAIIKEKTLYLDAYYPEMLKNYPHPDDKNYQKGLVPFYVKQIQASDGVHYVSAFPIVTPILVLPVYFVSLLLSVPINLLTVTYLGHISSALLMAVSGGLFYLLLKRDFDLSQKQAWLLTTIYMFATINFALISQAMWQHGTVELFTILAIYFLVNKKWFLFGLSAGLMVLSRPTAALVLPFLGLTIIYKWKDDFKVRQNLEYILKMLSGFLIPVLFFVWYTNNFYLGIQNNGYADQFLTEWQSRFPEGFLGLWLSPSKGILVYSPIFVFAFIGLWLARKNFQYLMYGAVVLVHTIVLSKWKHWYGGWSFGYRMAADVIPFLVLLIIPFLKSHYFEKYKKLFQSLLVFSILVQIFGIIFFDGIWHAAYDRGFVDTGWLWSIKDSEVAFNIRRVLVKFGYLDKACPKCLSN